MNNFINNNMNNFINNFLNDLKNNNLNDLMNNNLSDLMNNNMNNFMNNNNMNDIMNNNMMGIGMNGPIKNNMNNIINVLDQMGNLMNNLLNMEFLFYLKNFFPMNNFMDYIKIGINNPKNNNMNNIRNFLYQINALMNNILIIKNNLTNNNNNFMIYESIKIYMKNFSNRMYDLIDYIKYEGNGNIIYNMDNEINFLNQINNHMSNIYDNLMNNNMMEMNNSINNNMKNCLNPMNNLMNNNMMGMKNIMINMNDPINNNMTGMNNIMMNKSDPKKELEMWMDNLENMMEKDMRSWISNKFKFNWNQIGIIEYFVDFININEKYFILTSIKHQKFENKKINNYFFISLYNFNTQEEITKIEVVNIINLNENNFGDYRNKFTVNKNNNIFDIFIECNNITRNYKFLFVDEQLIEI